MSLSEKSAVEACVQLAARLGLGDVTPRIVGRFSNLAISLDPHPIVARVSMSTAIVRDALAFATREVTLTTLLVSRNAPAVRPCEPALAGPHRIDGAVVSLWQRVHIIPEAADAYEAGKRLAICHAILRNDPNPRKEFGILEELELLLKHPLVRQTSTSADRAMVALQTEACRNSLARILKLTGAPLQTLHGDAHLTNVFSTAQGPIWADWEDTNYGPIEWDLACLVTGARVSGRDRERAEQALQAYGPYDEKLLQLLIHVRALYGTAWLWLLAALDPSRLKRVPIWVDWLRRRQYPLPNAIG